MDEDNLNEQGVSPETEVVEENNIPPIETQPENTEAVAADFGGNLFSPEAVLMFPIAIILDLIGIALICFGLDDFFLTDIIGLIIIGGWIFFKSFGVEGAKEVKEISTKTKTAGSTRVEVKAGVKKIGARKWLRIICIGGELIPWVGAFFFWTILVWGELRKQ